MCTASAGPNMEKSKKVNYMTCCLSNCVDGDGNLERSSGSL